MKRLIGCALAVCFLLGGCGVIKENRTQGEPVAVSQLDMSGNEYPGRVETTAVYFLNETNGALTAELRPLVIDPDANPATVAVQALLAGPSSSNELTGVAPSGMTLDYIEFSRNVANVYLVYDGMAMTPEARYILEAALANTITDVLGAEQICVFYNGAAAGYLGVPAVPMQKQTGMIGEAWTQASAAYQSFVPVAEPPQDEDTGQTQSPVPQDEAPAEPVVNTLTTVLYFVSADGGFILPEVRSVTYTDGNYFEMLIKELQIGPQNTSIMTSPIADDLTLEEAVLTENDGGRYDVTLRFSGLPTQYDDAGDYQAQRSYAALIYTITGFIPSVGSVKIYVGDTQITTNNYSNDMHRDDYTGYIGSSAAIYFEDAASDLLIEVPRSMEQQAVWSPKARLFEIIKGPLAGDGDDVSAVMPRGVTADDILSVDVYTDTAYVDLSQNFKDACAGFSAKSEMRLVFSMVNTITAIDGINKVQFLVEGRQTQQLAGNLCLSDPFLRNYGIIKKTS